MDSIYISDYRKKLTTPEKAVESIADGSTVVPGLNAAEPPALLKAIADRLRNDDLKTIKFYSFNAQKHAMSTVLAPDLSDCVEAYSWFASSSVRSSMSVGLNYFIPAYFHEVPRLVQEFMDVDVAVTTVSPMDRSGYFSLGTSCDYTSSAARHCRTLIVEVNENMPRVFGESLLHVSEVDAIVENTVPLLELKPPMPKPEDAIIGKIIAEMVPDGATLQLGIGNLPNAVAQYLMDHQNLGVHSELFVMGMVDLVEKGVINGSKKSLHPWKHVFTTALGDRRMYEFMNDNPAIESYSASYMLDPAVIARNDSMISINSILEVDLLGQCNAEYLAGSQFSGVGGQLDFVRGAFKAKGGKSILAFYSTAKNGEVSRVVPRFKTGTAISTPRMDVHYLVTEYGAINLKGKSTRDRVLDIISIAHPKFRDELLRAAEEAYLL